MRISNTQFSENALNSINRAFSRYDAAQRQLSTGKRIQTPSDDPAGVAQSLGLRNRLDEVAQFGRVMEQAKSFLGATDNALSSTTELIRKARTLGVQGTSDALSEDGRNAIVQELDEVLKSMASTGNASYGSRYLFGGQRTDAPPFRAEGDHFIYQGGSTATGDGEIRLDIARGESMVLNAPGDKTLSPAMEAVIKLRDNVANKRLLTISNEDFPRLDNALSQVSRQRAEIGAKTQRLDQTLQRNEAIQINFTERLANIEDADIPKTIVEFQSAQTAYQAALQSTAKVGNISLLDYLR